MNEPGGGQENAGQWAPPSVPGHHEASAGDEALPPPPASDPSPRNRKAVYLVVAAILTVAVIGAVVLFVAGGDDGTTIATEQGEVADADEALQAAADEFLAAVEATGATVTDDTGCYWMLTPGGPEGDERFARSVACGPARFAAGGDWVVAPLDTTASTEDGGTVLVPFERAEFTDAEQLGIGGEGGDLEFVGVDGAEPVVPDDELGPPSAGGRAFVADGRLLESPDELIAAGTELISKPTGNAPLNVHPDASCWIPDGSLDEGGGGSVGQLLCGPVLSLDDDPSTPWKVITYTLQPGDGPWAAAADTESLAVSGAIALPTGVGLHHPDGAEPPPTDDFGLPDPLPVGKRYVGVGPAASLADLRFEPLAASTVKTPDFTVTLGGRVVADRIGAGRNAVIAPEGHRLLAFKYRATPARSESFDDYLDESSTAVVLAVGDDERTIELRELESVEPEFNPEYGAGAVYDTEGSEYAVVAVVPADVADVELEVQNRGMAQRVSLLTGKATGLAPGIERHGKEIQLTGRFDIVLEAPEARRAEYPPDAPGSFRGIANTATLSMWDDDRRWAPDGTILLTADLSEINIDSGDFSWTVGIDWSSTVTLVLPNGRVLKPIDVSSDLDEYQPEEFRFAVPLGTRSATLQVAPKGELSYFGEDAYRLTVDKVAKFPITLG